LPDAAIKVADEPWQPRPRRQTLAALTEYDGEDVGDRTLFEDDAAVHIGFTDFNAGSSRTPRSAARVVKRMAARDPVPSPKLKVEPPAVVTRRFPPRIKLLNTARSNRSIGGLLPRRLVPVQTVRRWRGFPK
jgi:hypothetical protein